VGVPSKFAPTWKRSYCWCYLCFF